MYLREYIESDFPTVFAVYKECEDFLSLGPESTATHLMVMNDIEESKKHNGYFYCIIESDNIVRIVDFIKNNYESNPQRAYISLIMLAKKHRNNGLGKRTIEKIEKIILFNSSIKEILVSVQINNNEAIRFWQSIGYNKISEAKLQLDGTTTINMKKLCNI